MLKEVKLSDLVPNPYRNLDKFPLDEDRVKNLVGSINRTDFWENVVTRQKDGHYELAYGHHRIEAARRVLGPNAKVGVLVKELDDKTMLQMMAADNDDPRSLSLEYKMEAVEAAARLLGYELGDKPGKFVLERKPGENQAPLQVIIGEFLGWSPSTTSRIIGAIKLVNADLLSIHALRKIGGHNSALRLSGLVGEMRRNGKIVSKETQMQIAKKVLNAEGNRDKIVRAIKHDMLHPVKKLPTDILRELLKEASNRANSLDVCLTEIKKHKNELHNYRTSLEVANLAASLQGITQLVFDVFNPKQLEGAKDEQSS